MFVLLLCVVSFSIANFGLNNIIQFAIPVLMFLYPLAIVLILLALSSSLFNNKQAVYASAMFLTFFVSLIDGYKALVISIPGAQLSLLDTVEQLFSDVLPLYDIDLGWILPAMIGVVIGLILPSKQTKIIH
ncbi:Branched-chain amino acid transport system carrier protein OS=Lysinibacillus sphaericus OX=1421 GN=LS41612_14140 PE=3 SV=1 [Lysinibacillus sphaericus]